MAPVRYPQFLNFFALSKGVRYRFFPGNFRQWGAAPLASSCCIGSSISMKKLGMHVMWKGPGNIAVYVYRMYTLQCLLIWCLFQP